MIRFSILHTSARPLAWRKVMNAWLAAADHPERVEYVLVVDRRWGFTELPELAAADQAAGEFHAHFNESRRCYVEGVNTAAFFSKGEVLVVNADDQFPCLGWDTAIDRMVEAGELPAPDKEFVLWAPTGTPREFERGIIVMPILSRARYQRLGYVFYPKYESMYADNDLCEHAAQDGALVRVPARLESSFVFPHLHAYFTEGVPMDDAYQEQNRQAAYDLGRTLYEARRVQKFGEVEVLPPVATRKTIACLLPGRDHPLEWSSAWTDLVMRLFQHFNLAPIFGYASDPVTVRTVLAQKALEDVHPAPDYVLWIDSDNVLPYGHAIAMLETLEKHPEVAAVACWCFLVAPESHMSCGTIDAAGKVESFTHETLMARVAAAKAENNAAPHLVEIDYTGFPAILMRRETLEKAGRFPFRPIHSDAFEYGRSGEDYAFSVYVRAAGLRIFVDSRLEIQHLKLGTLGGKRVSEGAAGAPVVLAATSLSKAERELAAAASPGSK